jgi:hypothetical protein
MRDAHAHARRAGHVRALQFVLMVACVGRRLRCAVCGVRYAVCGMRYAVCSVGYAVCGMRYAVSLSVRNVYGATLNT